MTRKRKYCTSSSQVLFRWIAPYIGRAEEYVIARKHQHIGAENRKHGAHAGEHASTNNWVNRFMRDKVGIKGHMAGYLLRRDWYKWMLEHKVPLAEQVLRWHTARVRDTNYVNRESITSIGLEGTLDGQSHT